MPVERTWASFLRELTRRGQRRSEAPGIAPAHWTVRRLHDGTRIRLRGLISPKRGWSRLAECSSGVTLSELLSERCSRLHVRHEAALWSCVGSPGWARLRCWKTRASKQPTCAS
jgi:hypothetical protein